MSSEKLYIESVDVLNRLRNLRLNESEDESKEKEYALKVLKEIENPDDKFIKDVCEILKINIAQNNDTPKEKKNDGAVPYTQQDDILGTSLQTCKTQFGADFSDSKTPMLYYPKDGDVVLSGKISRLGDAKFQFRLKDPSGYGCFVWTNPLQESDENLNTLKVIYGVYKNWKDDLHKSDDNRPLSIKNQSGPQEDGDDAEM